MVMLALLYRTKLANMHQPTTAWVQAQALAATRLVTPYILLGRVAVLALINMPRPTLDISTLTVHLQRAILMSSQIVRFSRRTCLPKAISRCLHCLRGQVRLRGIRTSLPMRSTTLRAHFDRINLIRPGSL